MKILGLMWEENSSAALMVNGRIVACASEERFSRAKNDERYPKNAIEYVLREGGVKPEELDVVAFSNKIWTPYYTLTRRYSTGTIADALREQNEYWYPRLYQGKKPRYLDIFKKKIDTQQYPGTWEDVLRFLEKNDGSHRDSKKIVSFFQEWRRTIVARHLGIDPKKIIFTDHHRGHAHYAYFASPIRQDALVLTLDAWGDNRNATVQIAHHGFLREVYSSDVSLIAQLYRYITLLLGMKPNEHEYKVMGLAPYAKERYYQKVLRVFEETQCVKGIGFAFKKVPPDRYFYFKEKLDGERFDAIAGALQKYTEDILTKWAQNCVRKTGLTTVCFGGGVAMNVKASMEINKLREVRKLFIPPSPGDESLAIGATQVCMADYCRERRVSSALIQPLQDAYLGPLMTEQDIRRTVAMARKNGYTVMKKVSSRDIAFLLAEGKVIGRAAGRSEFGARALGNRSLLADPRHYDIVKIINEKIKNRDFWMPFASTILEKRASDYLVGYKKQCGAPSMTLAFETTPLAHREMPAALHPADLTCRPQVLRQGENPAYEGIITAFEKMTGVGALLNTSFNLHGEPMVQTAADAYRVFRLSGIDGLLLNDTLLLKQKRR